MHNTRRDLPSPSPLPMGEGTVLHTLRVFSKLYGGPHTSLLPWGEGQGEGRELRSLTVRWGIRQTSA